MSKDDILINKVIRFLRMNTIPHASISQMHAVASNAATVFRILANQDRLLLLQQLSHNEMSVSELEEALSIHQPTLSQQLGVLRTENLVQTRRDGKRIYYLVTDQKILTILTMIYELYCHKDV